MNCNCACLGHCRIKLYVNVFHRRKKDRTDRFENMPRGRDTEWMDKRGTEREEEASSSSSFLFCILPLAVQSRVISGITEREQQQQQWEHHQRQPWPREGEMWKHLPCCLLASSFGGWFGWIDGQTTRAVAVMVMMTTTGALTVRAAQMSLVVVEDCGSGWLMVGRSPRVSVWL